MATVILLQRRTRPRAAVVHAQPLTREPHAHRAVNPLIGVEKRLLGVGVRVGVHAHEAPRPSDEFARRDGDPAVRVARLAQAPGPAAVGPEFLRGALRVVVLHRAIGRVGVLEGLERWAGLRSLGPGKRGASAEDETPEPGGHEDGRFRDQGVRMGGAIAEGFDEKVAQAAR